MDRDREDHEEIIRCRGRLHELESSLLAHGWRLDALDVWRGGVDRDLAGCRKDLDGVMSADAVAELVTEKLHTRQQHRYTFVQKAGGSLLGFAVFAGSLVSLVDAVRGW